MRLVALAWQVLRQRERRVAVFSLIGGSRWRIRPALGRGTTALQRGTSCWH